MAIVHRHRAAISRHELSRPIRLALDDELISINTTVFDYGCGRGDDVRFLREKRFKCEGWDPVFHPKNVCSPADVVNLGYVVNVIEDEIERSNTLQSSWTLAKRVLIVSGRLTSECSWGTQLRYQDGCITRLGTFQKYFEQEELRDWIDKTLDTQSVVAAPGVFYIFRDDVTKNSFLAARHRRQFLVPRIRRSEQLFDQNRSLLEPLTTFVAKRGRLPDPSEFELAEAIRNAFGSLNRAFAIIRRATGTQQWGQIREARAQDLLVYLALARFPLRPRFSKLSRETQLDVRSFFSSYARACAVADQLLFSLSDTKILDEACRRSGLGKLTGNALYVHRSALDGLSSTLRAYEGCARALVGKVEAANVIKLHRTAPRVSYLSYPTFEIEAHPSLAASLVVDLRDRRLRYQEYQDSTNPPILHRKEDFLAPDHPNREKFARLTRREEGLGLYDVPESIGTRAGWFEVLSAKKLSSSGHAIRRMK